MAMDAGADFLFVVGEGGVRVIKEKRKKVDKIA